MTSKVPVYKFAAGVASVQMLSQQSCWQRNERDNEQQKPVPTEQPVINLSDVGKYLVVLHPDDKHSDESDKRGQKGRPERDKRVRQTMVYDTLMSGYLDSEHKERNGDRAYPVTKRLDPSSFYFFLH
jgi:hypothetical protein